MKESIKLKRSTQMTIEDVNLMLTDSSLQLDKLNMLNILLSHYRIMSFSHVVLRDDNQFGMISTTPPQQILDYYHSNVWKVDGILSFTPVKRFTVIDYLNLSDFEYVKKYSQKINHNISVISTQRLFDEKHYFAFNICRDTFMEYKKASDFMNLSMIIKSAISLIYANIKITNFYKIHNDDNGFIFNENCNKDLSHPFLKKLTSAEIDYLKLIAVGISAKEIALQLKKSYRTVQVMTAKILKKLQISDKGQLTHIARIILAEYNY